VFEANAELPAKTMGWELTLLYFTVVIKQGKLQHAAV